MVLLALAALLLVLSVVRAITGAEDLTSSGTIGPRWRSRCDRHGRARRPVGRARRGRQHRPRGDDDPAHVGGGWAGYQWGPWTGVLVGTVFGAIGGLLHRPRDGDLRRRPHRLRGRHQHPGAGAAQFLSVIAFEGVRGGGESLSPPIADITKLSIPGVGPPCSTCRTRAFPALRLAGVVRGLFTGVSLLTVVAILLVIGSYVVLWRTAFGLRLRSCGREPHRGGVPRGQRLPDEVRRRRRLGGLRRRRRCLPRRRGRQRLPRGSDGGAGLHRPGGDDLRELAARWAGGRRGSLRLHRRASAAPRRRVRARAAAARRRLLVAAAVFLAGTPAPDRCRGGRWGPAPSSCCGSPSPTRCPGSSPR
jgi:hypothetical protein